MKSSMTKFKLLGVFAILAFLMATCTIAVAGNGSEGAEKEQSPPEEALTEEVVTLDDQMDKKIDVDFRETPIDDVIRMIAGQANLNVIKSPAVTGTVTATLRDVPVREALRNILETHGFGYITDENMIRIAPIDEIVEQSERIVFVSKIYQITYADVTEVAAALDKFKSPQGMVSFNKGTSNIIVTDTENKIEAMDRFVDQIDRITPQILVEVRIYDITSTEELDLGIEWDAGRNSVYVGGEPTAGPRDPFLTSGFEGATSNTAASTSGFLRFGFLNDSIDIDIQLRAEQENTHAKLLANPRIMVLDNEKALFNIVTEHPYVERTISGNTVTETVKFKPVGVNLEVTPHVTRDGMLRLHIIPEFSVFVERVTLATSDVPVVNSRKVNTITLIKDGQTVVLGGLRKKDVSNQVNKIPLLGDIPLLGALFRFEGENTTVNELVVFITPRIIKQMVLLEGEKQALEETEFGGPKPYLNRAEKKAEESEEAEE